MFDVLMTDTIFKKKKGIFPFFHWESTEIRTFSENVQHFLRPIINKLTLQPVESPKRKAKKVNFCTISDLALWKIPKNRTGKKHFHFLFRLPPQNLQIVYFCEFLIYSWNEYFTFYRNDVATQVNFKYT